MSKKKRPQKKVQAKVPVEKLVLPPKSPALFSSPKARGGLFLFLASVLLVSQVTFAEGNPDTNWLGLLGYSLAWTLTFFFGLGSYAITAFFAWLAFDFFKKGELDDLRRRGTYFALTLFSLCILLALVAESVPKSGPVFASVVCTSLSGKNEVTYHLGGLPFTYLFSKLPAVNLQRILSPIGTGLIFSTSFLLSFLLLTKIDLFTPLKTFWKARKEQKHNKAPLNDLVPHLFSLPSQEPSAPAQNTFLAAPSHKVPAGATAPLQEDRPSPVSPKKASFSAPTKAYPTSVFPGYTPPAADTLTPSKAQSDPELMQQLSSQARILEETLQSFGIEAKVGKIHCGPTIASFEVHPAIGVKVQKIKALENDLALNMQARSIRIIAPIPGKAAVGIEVPNPHPQEVSFREMLANYQKQTRRCHIPMILGKTVTGEDVIADLTTMPHLIIAGATGSGKSVCINTIVMSILMTASPEEIRLLMVDPKKVELTAYSQLPHMIAPVITESREAAAALHWLVQEMERRYEILKAVGVRNIAAFNKRKSKDDEAHASIEIPDKLPYFVAIVDELADLMMVSSQDIETPIARIAQMARAVGIHLILATQRPSREVITGLIKANFPTRIAFKVASRVNSQIILDDVGAEALLGNGDLLFLPPGTAALTRAQGAYVRDEDIASVVGAICERSPPNYLISSFAMMASSADEGKGFSSETDALYEQARKIVMETGNASTTFLQRKLRLGYARAASLMDELESEGVIGPADGSRARKVLITSHHNLNGLEGRKDFP